MKPDTLRTQIFLDSGNPAETKTILETLSFLDGQTTNPSLVAKNPIMAGKIAQGGITSEEAFAAYRTIIDELSGILPNGSISVEVYADMDSSVESLLAQARDMYKWAPNLHVKLPCTKSGIEAAHILAGEGMRLNMTLCFSQAQAAAVHVATLGAVPGQVYISPFIGRLDDKGMNGIDLIKNILAWYRAHDSNVMVLAASVRTMDHFLASLALGSDIITAPGNILAEWAQSGMTNPDGSYVSLNADALAPIPYEELPLHEDFHAYDIGHELTTAGIQKFVADWKGLLKA